MEKTVQTTASFAADRGHCQPYLHRSTCVTQIAIGCPTSRPHLLLVQMDFCVDLCMMTDLPPQSEHRWGRQHRQQPVLLLIEVGHCQPLLHRSASVTKRCHLMPNVTVTSFVDITGFCVDLCVVTDLPLEMSVMSSPRTPLSQSDVTRSSLFLLSLQSFSV